MDTTQEHAARLAAARAALAQATAGAPPRRSGSRGEAGDLDPDGRAAGAMRPDVGVSTGAGADADAEPDPEAVARSIVLRQLAMAPRSRAQLEDKLRARHCPPEVAQRVLDRFTEVGLVDDRAYARSLVRSRQETKGLARRALAHELRRKGVDDDIVAQSLADIEPPQEEDQARRLVEKRLRTLHGLDPAVQTRRLAGMLARKGYPSALSYRVISEALAQSPEHRRD